MDRQKQVKKLVKDALGENFEIEINNNNENVNVVCNTGFYSTVAIPALHNLAKSRVSVFDGISVSCQDIIGTLDSSLAQQTTILYFRLSKNTDSMGAVRIHLHHTARKVQLQGGAVMPNKTTAPVWFVDNVLRDIFTRESRDKAESIRAFNQAISSLKPSIGSGTGTTSSMCKGCNIQFNGRSSPEFCSQCGYFYHKYKCYPSSNHPCHLSNREEGSSNLSDASMRQHRRTGTLPSLAVDEHPAPFVNTGGQSGPGGGRQQVHPSSEPDLSVLPMGAAAVQADTHPLSLSTTGSLAVPPIRFSAVESVTTMAVRAPQPPPYATRGQQIPAQSTQPPATQPQHQVMNPLTSLSGTSIGSVPTHGHMDVQSMTCTSITKAVPTPTTLVPSHAPVLPSLLPRSTPGQLQPVTGGLPGPVCNNSQLTVNDPGSSTQRKQAAKKKKPPIPTDTAGVTLEFNKVEISTLQARLQKQQIEVNDLRFKNSILMERNKILEEAQTKTIHDHYFPPQQPASAPDPTQTLHCHDQTVRARNYCSHHCQPCFVPPLYCQHQNCHADLRSSSTSTSSYNEIRTLMLELREAVNILQLRLDRLEKPESSPTQPDSSPSKPVPDITLESTQEESALAVSPAESLEGFMFSEEESQNHLN